jgi:Tfp pilus assembly protein PilN
MRPINLIPSELQRGAQAPMRTGVVPYVVLGALVALLAGVALLVLTGNQISDRKAEVATLKQEDAAAEQEATRLAAYVQFQTLHEQRVATISSLADSRFDWERVMRELSLILPHDVWLTNLDASASPLAETAGEAGGGALRGSIPGPALQLSGCAAGQESVAGFVAVLKDIDGVTRIGVENSELPEQGEGAGSAGSGGASGDGGGECRTRSFIAKFQIVVAFDAAPVPPAVTGEGEVAGATETAEATATGTEASESEAGEGE